MTQSFYSPERDLAQLRLDTKGKGILSPNDTVDTGTTAGENPKKILTLVIGGNLWTGPGPVPKILIVGHHAREWISVEIPYLLAEYLIGKYDPSPGLPADDAAVPGTPAAQAQRIKHLVGNREIWFIPMLNAEGHDHTILTSRKWRPNRSTTTIFANTVMTVLKLGGGHTPSSYLPPVRPPLKITSSAACRKQKSAACFDKIFRPRWR